MAKTDREHLIEGYEMLLAARGEDVTWRRPDQATTTTVTIIRARTRTETADETGAVVQSHKPAFIVRIADLGFWPAEGHVIETADGQRWRVNADEGPPWRWHIEEHSVRVHATLTRKPELDASA